MVHATPHLSHVQSNSIQIEIATANQGRTVASCDPSVKSRLILLFTNTNPLEHGCGKESFRSVLLECHRVIIKVAVLCRILKGIPLVAENGPQPSVSTKPWQTQIQTGTLKKKQEHGSKFFHNLLSGQKNKHLSASSSHRIDKSTDPRINGVSTPCCPCPPRRSLRSQSSSPRRPPRRRSARSCLRAGLGLSGPVVFAADPEAT